MPKLQNSLCTRLQLTVPALEVKLSPYIEPTRPEHDNKVHVISRTVTYTLLNVLAHFLEKS